MSNNAIIIGGIAVFAVVFICGCVSFVRNSRSTPREYWAEDFEPRRGPRDDVTP